MDGLVKALRETIFSHGHRNVELEFRLGRTINDCFVAGVSRTSFENIQKVLEKSAAFVRSEVTTLEKVNGTDARFIITNGDEAHGKWCYKKKVHVWTGAPNNENMTHRASVSLEGNDRSPPPPGSPPFKYHRLKKRTSFRHEWWSVDLTRVTSNLPGHFDNDEEIYEVEVELVGLDAYYIYTLEHLVAWGHQLLTEIERHSRCNQS